MQLSARIPFLLCSLILQSTNGSHIESVMTAMEAEIPGSVDWFIQWGKEEDILDMYRDVILGTRNPNDAFAHNYAFRPQAARTYIGVLYYYCPEIRAQQIHAILAADHFRSLIPRPLTIKEIEKDLKLLVGLTGMTVPMFRAIYDNREQANTAIAEAVRANMPSVTIDLSVSKLAIIVRIWNTFCVSLIATRGSSDSCFFDHERKRWWLIGPGRTAIVRTLLLSLIS